MRIAIVNNQRTEASKGLKGICPVCNQPVTAKCGELKINHWAHLSKSNCDKWWENETEWHRAWKNKFPLEWQEIVAIDEKTGEKHIADVKTNKGMVIEFQHSYISAEERISRERFYKDMIWVVAGTRCERDVSRFEHKRLFRSGKFYSLNIYQLDPYFLPKQWLKSSVPVLFDFKGLSDIKNSYYDRTLEPLWCLLPSNDYVPTLIEFNRNTMIEMVKDNFFSSTIKAIIDALHDNDNTKSTNEDEDSSINKEEIERNMVPLKACRQYCQLNKWNCSFCDKKTITKDGEIYVVCSNPDKQFLEDYKSESNHEYVLLKQREDCPF